MLKLIVILWGGGPAAVNDEIDAPKRCRSCGRTEPPTTLDFSARHGPCGHRRSARITSDDPRTIHVVASWVAAHLAARADDPALRPTLEMIWRAVPMQLKQEQKEVRARP